jgi:alkylation response protein AidB-like acyl-CoA dehydrogenase
MKQPIYRNIPDSHGNNAYLTDPDFASLLEVYLEPPLRDHVTPLFEELGGLVGGELEELAREADANPPSLKTRNRDASPAIKVEKHPAYRRMEHYAYSRFGLAAMSHRAGVFDWPEKLPPIVKYGLTYLFVQAEFGLLCPVSMTDSLTRTLTQFGDQKLIDRYFEQLTSQDGEILFQGAMFMTEQDAGSDVGAITTEARVEDGVWRLYGDKWFCSNADADLAMVLARPREGGGGTRGLTLFLLPRVLADGSLNNYRIVRLKDKLGTRAMASGEIKLEGAEAHVVGEPGSGFKQMTSMINNSRLSNGVRSAGMMRRAVGEALFIARNRKAFGRKLIELPLLQRTLIKMMVTAEQGRSMVLHTADCMRRADAGDRRAEKLLRIFTPLIKFRTTRDARKVAGDGMEVRGGCGYIEEWSDPRVLRDSHLGSIWEGTSNIVALDVFRSIRRNETLPVLRDYLAELIAQSDLSARDEAVFRGVLERTTRAAQKVADEETLEAGARRTASALYHCASAVFLAWEAAQMGANRRRLALAKQVLAHKLMPRDPLAPDTGDTELTAALLTETPISGEQVTDRWEPAAAPFVEEITHD